MGRWAIGYGATALAFLMLDVVWLSTAATALYRPALGELLAPRFQLVPAVAFYLIYAAGILGLAVAPALRDEAPLHAAGYGAALGFVAYATYDLTNLATVKGWPAKLALIDLGWGTLATALAALAGAMIMSSFARS